MRTSTMIALILLLASSASLAELVEFPMTTLTGTYPGDQAERTAPFLFGHDTARIASVFLRTGGKATEGAVNCGGKEPEPWLMDVGAVIVDPGTGGWWTA